MTCEAARHALSAWLDGEAEVAGRREAEAHLTACARCRQARDATVALRTGLQAAGWPVPDADARDEQVLAVLRQEGIIRKPAHPEPSRHRPAGLRGLCQALWPGVAAMTAAFLVTWLPLRLAESGRLMPHSPPTTATADRTPAPETPSQPEWLRRAARLAARLHGERVDAAADRPAPAPASTPRAPGRAPKRGSAAERPGVKIG